MLECILACRTPDKALDVRFSSEEWLSVQTGSDFRSVQVGSRGFEVPSPVRPDRSGEIAAHYMAAQALVAREPVHDHGVGYGFAQVIAAVDSEEVAVRCDQAPGAVVDVAKALANPDMVENRFVELLDAAGTKRWRVLQMTGS